MKKLLVAAAVLALAACGKDEAPKPATQVAPVTPAPQVAPAPKPEAKAPEAPTPDPNKALAARVKAAADRKGSA